MDARYSRRSYIVERIIAAAVLFYGAMVLCLPVPSNDEVAQLYPWWAKRAAFGNVLLHELIFVAWLMPYGAWHIIGSFFAKTAPARQSAMWLIALAVWCGIVSLSAPLLWMDVGRTLRLLLNVGMLLAVARWAWKFNEFPLMVLVLGFLAGTVINLSMSYEYPLVVDGIMRLSGQNTPGVAMGVAIHLTAWLFYRSEDVRLQILSFCATLIFAFSCIISFSRIGWFVGGLGTIAWLYVIFLARPACDQRLKRFRNARRIIIPLLIGCALLLPKSQIAENVSQWFISLVESKVSYEGEGDRQRLAYLFGTMEIVAKHPLGVGYSAFYDAMTATETYRSPEAAVEDSPSEANPHATFLWYAAAGGFPGFAMAMMVFIMLLNRMRVGLVAAMERDGFVLFLLAAPAYLLMGLTVPYLFNSIILIVPAAIAAGWGQYQKGSPNIIRHYTNGHRHA